MLTSLFSEVKLDRDEMESHYFNACFEEFSVSITVQDSETCEACGAVAACCREQV